MPENLQYLAVYSKSRFYPILGYTNQAVQDGKAGNGISMENEDGISLTKTVDISLNIRIRVMDFYNSYFYMFTNR